MASVREQILELVEVKLGAVAAMLGWANCIRNPREDIGEDQMDVIALYDGAEPPPEGMTGHVDDRRVAFMVVLAVNERGATAEVKLDQGYVEVSDVLLDPNDIQLSGLAVAVEQHATTEPYIGYSDDKGARVVGFMAMHFSARYFAREGDASTPGP